MIEIRVMHTFPELKAWLAGIQFRQIPYATVLALNRTAARVQDAEVGEMRSVFDRPTPYTLSALRIRKASKANLTAYVEPKYMATKAISADKFLAPQILGGSRKQKRFERALIAVGAMPEGYVAVPGAGARLDAYGNMSRGQIVQILSYFRAFPESGYRANMTEAGRQSMARGSRRSMGYTYFAGRPGRNLPLGIWQRHEFSMGQSIRPVLIFVKSTHYRVRLKFDELAKKTVDRNFEKDFEVAMEQAVATAR
ncbi:MAG: hypothetical protein ACYCZR_03095 [Burkholderiales bacterium]